MGTPEGAAKRKLTMIAKYKQPGMTDEQAYEAYRADMRALGSVGGRNGTGHEFAHGKVDQKIAGSKGGRISRVRRVKNESV